MYVPHVSFFTCFDYLCLFSRPQILEGGIMTFRAFETLKKIIRLLTHPLFWFGALLSRILGLGWKTERSGVVEIPYLISCISRELQSRAAIGVIVLIPFSEHPIRCKNLRSSFLIRGWRKTEQKAMVLLLQESLAHRKFKIFTIGKKGKVETCWAFGVYEYVRIWSNLVLHLGTE